MTPTLTECMACACEVCGVTEADVRRDRGSGFTGRRLFYVLGREYAGASSSQMAKFIGRRSKSGCSHAVKEFYADTADNRARLTAMCRSWMSQRKLTPPIKEEPREVVGELPTPPVWPTVRMPQGPPPVPLGQRFSRWANDKRAWTMDPALRAEIDRRYAESLSAPAAMEAA